MALSITHNTTGLVKVTLTHSWIFKRVWRHFVIWNDSSFLAFLLRSSSQPCLFYLYPHWSNKYSKRNVERNLSHCLWSLTRVYREHKWVVSFVKEVSVMVLPTSRESHHVQGEERPWATGWGGSHRDQPLSLISSSKPVSLATMAPHSPTPLNQSWLVEAGRICWHILSSKP